MLALIGVNVYVKNESVYKRISQIRKNIREDQSKAAKKANIFKNSKNIKE